MTLLEIQSFIEEFNSNQVRITLTNNTEMKCVLRDAYPGHPHDPRGYTEPYLFVVRIDKPENVTEKYYCSEVRSIERI